MRLSNFCLTILVIVGLHHATADHELKNPSLFSNRFEFDNGVYFISLTKLAWFDARNLCLSEDTNLVALETLEESEAIKEELRERNYTDPDNVAFWTSGVDTFTPLKFYWDSNGLTFDDTYSGWGSGEPDNRFGNEHCVQLGLWHDYAWNDNKCDEVRHFICEWHSSV